MYLRKRTKNKRNHSNARSLSKRRQHSKKYKRRTLVKGGSAFFSPTYNLSTVNPYNNYDLNTYSNLPSVESARNLPAMTTGGGKMKSNYRLKKYRKNKSRKLGGGGLAALSPDTINSGLNSSGSSIINYSPYEVPINVPYGTHNPALI